MAIDIQCMTPTSVVRLLNTYSKKRIAVNRIYADFRDYGMRIASCKDNSRVNLLLYAGALYDTKARVELERESNANPADTYERHKANVARRRKEISATGRDIAPLPPVEDPNRRDGCRLDLRRFCETYFPETFYLGWSADHLKAIAKIEQATLNGGLFALAMPRGSGKTTLVERSALWAILYGHRKFVTLIGASEEASRELCETIKVEIESNEILSADFPESCYPVAMLEGINNRTAGQTLDGKQTRISWGAGELVFPTVDGSPSSGAVVLCTGITGRIRGLKRKVCGKDTRPDFVLIDDPQTDESASSAEQNNKRLRILNGAILGLAGPKKKISGIMPCTVIRPDDMADRILNREKSPEWNGERMRLVEAMPSNMELWWKYREISADCYRRNGNNEDGTAFYAEHREEMDAGAKVNWVERFNPDQLSGVQYAMDIYFQDRQSFFAEFQNEPCPDEESEAGNIKAEEVFACIDNLQRDIVPESASELTMFVDVQKRLLYYSVIAFSEDFKAWVVDYGAFPDQQRSYFTLGDAHPTYLDIFKGQSQQGAIYSAVKGLCEVMLEKRYTTEDGREMKISCCLVDSGWGESTESVYRACRESAYSAILMPSKGVGITAAQRPMTEYRKNIGDKIGYNWYIAGKKSRAKGASRVVEYDTNFWKSFFRTRLRDGGAFGVFGDSRNIERHRMLAEQLSAETSVATSGRGRVVDVWTCKPGRDNHFLDCVVGCFVCASMRGCNALSAKGAPPARGIAGANATPKRNAGERRKITLGRTIELHNR